jgi:dual specificity phosphatase 12
MSDQDMTVYFDEIVTFINTGRKSGNCLVHCNAGVSRAATAIIYYLFKENHMTIKEAGIHLKGIRPIIDPNDGFKTQLIKAEIQTNIDPRSDREIKCKMCRCTLLKTSQSNFHEKGVNKKRFNKKPANRYQGDNIQCNKIFMDRMEWMGDVSELEGVLYCPKCKTKVGGYKWDGEQCSCGVWIVPSIHVHKAKVDV